MTNISRPIVFFGTDEFSLATLAALVEAGYSIAAVVTKPDSKQGRGHKLLPPVVKTLATKHSIPVWQPEKLSEIVSDIEKLDKPVGILSSYGKIIPKRIIDLFEPGIINIHPSLLPKYRGPSPIESAIANGDDKTGVSIMLLSTGMDNGPIYTVKEHPLTKRETSRELYRMLADIGANLLVETLPSILDGTITPLPQDDTKATYTKILTKEDGWLIPETMSAAEAEQKVRAHLIFPKTKITIKGFDIIVTKAHVSQEKNTAMDVLFSDNNYLSIDELIAPSGRLISAKDFLIGYLRT